MQAGKESQEEQKEQKIARTVHAEKAGGHDVRIVTSCLCLFLPAGGITPHPALSKPSPSALARRHNMAAAVSLKDRSG